MKFLCTLATPSVTERRVDSAHKVSLAGSSFEDSVFDSELKNIILA